MKKLITFIFILSAIFSFAEERPSQNDRGMKSPPKEAITSCESKNEGDSCSFETPRGDTIEGICENTPDGKYFACKPNNMDENRPPRR